jgi:hypothetical protein
MTDAERLADARRIVQGWLDKQGHERCWYYPDLFNQLAVCLELVPATEPDLPPLLEFEEGCRRYQAEQYAGPLAQRGTVVGLDDGLSSMTVAEAFQRETGFRDPRK